MTTMGRVAVVGCSGTGKTTLALELGRRLGLPVIHLDKLYWRPGWAPTPQEEWEARQTELFAAERWVADGNFQGTLHHRLARADTVVFLDFPRRACVRGVIGRWLRQRGEVREDMAPGCPERFDLDFMRWVWRFRRDARPRTLESLASYVGAGGRVIVLRSRREVAQFLRGVDRDGVRPSGIPIPDPP